MNEAMVQQISLLVEPIVREKGLRTSECGVHKGRCILVFAPLY